MEIPRKEFIMWLFILAMGKLSMQVQRQQGLRFLIMITSSHMESVPT